MAKAPKLRKLGKKCLCSLMKAAKELLNCPLQGLLKGGLLPFTCSISCILDKQKVQSHGKKSH